MTGIKGKLLHSDSPWRLVAWILVGALLLAGVFLLLVRPIWINSVPVPTQVLFWLVSIGELVGLLYLVRLVIRYQDRLALTQQQQQESDQRVSLAYQRLDAIFRVSQKFLDASDEREVIELVLRLSIDLVGAKGASFVPLDDHGQPLAMISQGEMPVPGIEAWMEYLATPEIHQQCGNCNNTGTINRTCPLLHTPSLNASGIYCLPLGRDEHEFGMLNLYMPDDEPISQDTHAFLGALIDQTALALEGVRLRRRELAALRQMQIVRQKNDLNGQLSGLLDNVNQTVDSDFAMLVISQPGSVLANARLIQGDLPLQSQPFVDGVTQGVIASTQPVLLSAVSGDATIAPTVHSLIAVPLLSGRATLGALVAGNCHATPLNKRQLSLLQIIAGQVALVVQNADTLAELEYATIIQERTRLAREIHDGLAQTLGFLKLQASQMRNYLARGDSERARESLELYFAALSEAYQDVRQTIDGLRIEPANAGLDGWLEQTVIEFR
ncbi:MAG: two-component sensor histidine kinase, partial [Chloroflexi bacterium]|nr:two-component sensor histidine kinase [Chloroflexota bacterium]